MTCREKLKLENPDYIHNGYKGGCVGCPDDYGYMHKPAYCDRYDTTNATCTVCWDRKIPEREKITNTITPVKPCLPNTIQQKQTGEQEMEEKYKHYYNRATELELAGERREWLVNKIKYLQTTVIPAIEEEVYRRDKVLADWKKQITYLNDDKRILNLDIEKKAKEIQRLEGVIKELEELNVSKQNENVELKKVFEEEITKLKLDIERKNERIKELICDNDDLYAVNTALHEEIERSKLVIKGTPLSEVKKEVFNQYCMNDIQMTQKLAFFAKDNANKSSVNPDAFENWQKDWWDKFKYKNYDHLINKTEYERTAEHMYHKFKALIDAGFSHDDAMMLIPIWTDDCEVTDAD